MDTFFFCVFTSVLSNLYNIEHFSNVNQVVLVLFWSYVTIDETGKMPLTENCIARLLLEITK